MKFKSNAGFGEPVERGTIFKCKAGNVNVSIHRIVQCEGWFLSCPDLKISQWRLKSGSLIGAINESKEILKSTAETLMKNINIYCEEPAEFSRY